MMRIFGTRLRYGVVACVLFGAALAGIANDEASRASLIRLLPGGDQAGSVDEQVSAIASVAESHGDKAVAYRLWKISQLSPEAAVREAALASLKALPAELLPEGVELAAETAGGGGAVGGAIDPAKMARGKEVYMRPAICFSCHQPNGMGLPGAFPPLAGSEWLDGDTDRLIKIVLKGLIGPIEVSGQSYNSAMAPLESLLKDEEIADVLTYVRNSWGNEGPEVLPDQVAAVREAVKDQAGMFQIDALLKEHPLQP